MPQLTIFNFSTRPPRQDLLLICGTSPPYDRFTTISFICQLIPCCPKHTAAALQAFAALQRYRNSFLSAVNRSFINTKRRRGHCRTRRNWELLHWQFCLGGNTQRAANAEHGVSQQILSSLLSMSRYYIWLGDAVFLSPLFSRIHTVVSRRTGCV